MTIRRAITPLMLVSGAGLAQINQAPNPPTPHRPPAIIIQTNLFPGASNSVPGRFLTPPSTAQPLVPGIYQTKPFACLVKVPEPNLDDCRLHAPTNAASIPIWKPNLQFVPVPPAGK